MEHIEEIFGLGFFPLTLLRLKCGYQPGSVILLTLTLSVELRP